MSNNVCCKQCGWVQFPVTPEYIEEWHSNWKEVCKTKPLSYLKMYGIKGRKAPSKESYYKCFVCNGPYTNFRDAKEGDCPDGCTIQPILGYQYAVTEV